MKIIINEKKTAVTMICREKFVTLFHDFDCVPGMDFQTWVEEVKEISEKNFVERWEYAMKSRKKCYRPSEYKYVGFVSDTEKDFPDYLNTRFFRNEFLSECVDI